MWRRPIEGCTSDLATVIPSLDLFRRTLTNSVNRHSDEWNHHFCHIHPSPETAKFALNNIFMLHVFVSEVHQNICGGCRISTAVESPLWGCMSHCTDREIEGWNARVLMLISIRFRSLFVRDEVTGDLRKLHNQKLSDPYFSPNIFREIKSRKMKWAGHVARMRERWGLYGVLLGKPEEKRPIGRARCRWEDNIK